MHHLAAVPEGANQRGRGEKKRKEKSQQNQIALPKNKAQLRASTTREMHHVAAVPEGPNQTGKETERKQKPTNEYLPQLGQLMLRVVRVGADTLPCPPRELPHDPFEASPYSPPGRVFPPQPRPLRIRFFRVAEVSPFFLVAFPPVVLRDHIQVRTYIEGGG